MREILFRAKRIDNGEWVEGNLITNERNERKKYIGYIFEEINGIIEDFDIVEVIPNTICQYTGLTDKNGNRIWENDILKGFTYPFLCDGEFNYFVTVEWSEEYKYFFLYTLKNPQSTVRGISEGNSELFEDFNSDDWEIIGNIFDNPELLGGKNEQMA